jgi:hypothetical protein
MVSERGTDLSAGQRLLWRWSIGVGVLALIAAVGVNVAGRITGRAMTAAVAVGPPRSFGQAGSAGPTPSGFAGPPSTLPSSVPTCSPASLTGKGGWQTTTGAAAGIIRLTNRAQQPCSLSGIPQIVIESSSGPLAIRQVRSPPEEQEAATTVVLLTPGVDGVVSVGVRWFNWCGDQTSHVVVHLLFSGSAQPVTVQERDFGLQSRPRCDDPSQGSTIDAGAVEGISP